MQHKSAGGAPKSRAGKAVVAVWKTVSGVKDKASSLVGRASRVPDRLMMASDTDALGLLEAQHRAADALFARTASATGAERRALFEELAEVLEAHATIEERHFYPAVDTYDTEDLVRESYEEHADMRALVEEVRGSSDDEFEEKLAALQKAVQHHAKEEEEGKLFPRVARMMDGDQREALGQEMLATMVDLMEGGPTRH